MQLTRLRELRQRAFLTQAELGQKAGMSETTINRLEMGKNSARISTVRRLADVLGVTPAELVGTESSDTKRAA
jgi:transcriptional regulator with XRE-family HTH domain